MDIIDPYGAWPFEPRRWQTEALEVASADIGGRPLVRAVMGAGKSVLIGEICYQWRQKVVVTTPTKELVNSLASTIGEVCDSVGRYFSDAKEWHETVIVCCYASLPSLIHRMMLRGVDINSWAWIADECHRTETPTVLGCMEDWDPVWRVGLTATPCRSDHGEKISLFDSLVYDYGPWEAIKDGVIVPYRLQHPPHPRRDINEECIEWIKAQSGPGVVDAISIEDAREFAKSLEAVGVNAIVVHSELPGDEVGARVKKAQKEDGCLVHVDLLSEGVDMPWLRWLVVRRPTGSSVRFAQYVGRGLRSHPGKDHCPVFDPHDLFGELSIDPEAVLSGGEGDEPKTVEEYELKLEFLLDTEQSRAAARGEKLDGTPKNILTPAASWIRRVSQGWKARGVLPMRLADGPLRREKVGETQRREIARHYGIHRDIDMPDRTKKALAMAMRVAINGDGVDWGTASDLIQMVKHLHRSGVWPVPEEDKIAA